MDNVNLTKTRDILKLAGVRVSVGPEDMFSYGYVVGIDLPQLAGYRWTVRITKSDWFEIDKDFCFKQREVTVLPEVEHTFNQIESWTAIVGTDDLQGVFASDKIILETDDVENIFRQVWDEWEKVKGHKRKREIIFSITANFKP